jgi:hypothetical protein
LDCGAFPYRSTLAISGAISLTPIAMFDAFMTLMLFVKLQSQDICRPTSHILLT